MAAMRAKIVRLMLTRAKNPRSNNPDNIGNATQGSTEPLVLTVPLSGGNSSTVQTTRGRGNATRIEFTAVSLGDFALAPDVYKSTDELGKAAVPIHTAVPVVP